MKKLIYVLSLVCMCACTPVPYIPLLQGDCVDRAVGIRQTLRSQGYEAQLILGRRGNEGHCWIVYKDKETGEWIKILNY